MGDLPKGKYTLIEDILNSKQDMAAAVTQSILGQFCSSLWDSIVIVGLVVIVFSLKDKFASKISGFFQSESSEISTKGLLFTGAIIGILFFILKSIFLVKTCLEKSCL